MKDFKCKGPVRCLRWIKVLSLVAKIRYKVISSHPSVVDVLKVAIIMFTPADTQAHAYICTLLKKRELKSNEKFHLRNLGGVATATWKGQEINKGKTYWVFERIALSKKPEKVFDSLTCSEGSHSILIIDVPWKIAEEEEAPRRQIQEPLRIMEKGASPRGQNHN